MDDAVAHIEAFLQRVGFHDDPEMAETPARFAALMASFVPHQRRPEVQLMPTRGTTPVVVRDLVFYSLCAHHLLPFFGTVSVGYRPAGGMVGLGYFPKLVRHYARQPQIQERLADQLVDAVFSDLAPTAAVVRITARQLCMEMRGAEATGVVEVIATRGAEDELLAALLIAT